MKLSRIKLPLLLFVTIIVIGVISCVKETYDTSKLSLKADLNPGVSIPAAYGTIKIGEFLENIDVLDTTADGVYIYSDDLGDLDSIDVGELIEIDDEDIGAAISNKYVIEDFTLDDIDFEKIVTLSSLADNLDPLTKQALSDANGLNIFPNVPAQDGGTYPASQNDDYEYVTLSEGIIVLSITNNFADTITNITIEINDSSAINNTGFYSHIFIFNNIPVDVNVSDSVSLVGETLYNPINFKITNIEIAGPSFAARNIDFDNDQVTFSAIMKNIEVESGSAKINLPEALDSTANQRIEIDEDDIELYSLTLLSGRVNYDIVNRMSRQISIFIKFPYTFLNGDTVKRDIIVPPYQTETGFIEMAESLTDLTLGGDSINTFALGYRIEIDTTGEFTTFTNSDSVSYDFSFENIEFDIIEGYFGQDTTSVDSTMEMDMGGNEMFDRIEGGFNIANPQLIIEYENSLGIPIDMDLELSTEENGTINTAGGAKVIGLPGTPGELVVDNIIYDKDNDLDKVFKFPLPELMNYKFDVFVNKNGKIPGNPNFITHDGKFKIGMGFEVPVALRSEGFLYRDTLDIDSLIPEQIDMESATIVFKITNELPFNISIEAFPWDSAGGGTPLYDSPVIDAGLIEASVVDDNGNVIQPSEYSTKIGIDSDGFDNIMISDRLVIHASIDTKNANNIAQNVKLKSDLEIKLLLVVQSQVHITSLDFDTGNDEGN